MKKVFWYLLPTVIFAGMVYAADIGRIVEALQTVDTLFLVPAVLCGTLALTMWSLVWQSFFELMAFDISYPQTFRLFAAAEFLNNITPLGQAGGQPFMAYIIADNVDIEYEEALATVISGDVITVIPFLTIFSTTIGYMVLQGVLMRSLWNEAVMLIGLVLFGFAVMYLFWFRFEVVEDWVSRAIQFVGWISEEKQARIETALENTRNTFEHFSGNPRRLVKPALFSHGGFIARISLLGFVLLALGVPPNIPYLVFIVPVAAIAKTSPTPGGSGTYELAMAGMITAFFGTSFAIGVTAAVLFRLCAYWQFNVLGYLAIISLGFSHEDIASMSKQPADIE